MKKNKLGAFLKYIPLLAPIPEGYAVGLAIARELQWNIWFVVISACVVALTGFYGVYTRTALSEFNATLHKDEIKEIGKVHTWKADLILAIWFLGVVMITVFLDTMPTLKTLTPVAIVVIGFGSNYLYALSNILQEHQEARQQYRVTKTQEKVTARNERKEERKSEKSNAQSLASLKQAIEQKTKNSQGGKPSKTGSKLSNELLLLEWTKNPNLTPTQMAEILGQPVNKGGYGIVVTRQAISQRREAMAKAGIIAVDSNGRVVERISDVVLES